jgi:hypothetical protein
LENKEVKWLGATAIFFLLALITHEESFILLPILLIINRLPITDYRLRPTAYGHRLTDYRLRLRETLFFSGLFVLTAVYLYIQFTRPNLTLEADKIGLTGYLTHIRLGEIGRFVIDTVVHMTLWFNLPGLLGSFELVMAALVVMGLALWFWRGSNLVRLGLLWAGLHLGFIYFALWTQKPELYAGRHIYQAGIGLLWAIGASIDWLFHKVKQAKSAKKRLKRPNNRLRLTHYGLSILITAVLIANIRLTHNIQKGWLQRAERYQKAEAQVKAILPQVNDRTRIYATRFPITPTFLPATFQVWYETTIDSTGGGDLAQLSADGKANRDAYVFDYQDGNVYNLMPELQAHEETVFVWAGDGRIEQLNPQNQTSQPLDDKLEPILAGPPDDLRLSIVPPDTDATAGTWTSLVYLLTVPQDSQLQFSLHTKDAAEFRVRVLGDDSEWKTLWETAVTTPNQWTDITIPMDNYWGQAIVIRLETIGNGLWGNPRFTVK